MNIKAYDLDSLRRIIRELIAENQKLRNQLKANHIPMEESPGENVFDDRPKHEAEYDPDQGARMITRYINTEMIRNYFSIFCGRSDVFARRAKNGNYYPQCRQRWNYGVCPKTLGEQQQCGNCNLREWIPLDAGTILKHLLGYKEDGTDVLGVYPLFPDDTCRFLVFDFDNHEKDAATNDFANTNNVWRNEVDALRRMCLDNEIKPLVERSRSGKGAHVWIIFRKRIPASLAREFGSLLLEKGASSVNLPSFRYYDRMFPTQDTTDGLGNLVALPLQGQALRNGNSAFVDENWNAYPDQWDYLLCHTQRLSMEDVQRFILKWQEELSENGRVLRLTPRFRGKPWKENNPFSRKDVIGTLHIVLGNGIYVDALNLMPRLQNQIRSMCAFDNPVYYEHKRHGHSNYATSSTVYLGKDIDGYIRIPRGLQESLRSACETARIPYEIQDEREKGRPIRVAFNGNLRIQQNLAAHNLLTFDNGILSAATAFGKTVVCAYLISQRKVNTLILIESRALMKQWVDELDKFLDIDEEPPEYQTKTGRTRRRKSVIGTLQGGQNKLTGIIDVAMLQSVYANGEFVEQINQYGMVIMDECHHAASPTGIRVLQRINSRYVYGVSATPKRSDSLEKIIFMMIGPVRHQFTAKERAAQQGIEHYVYPRYTRLIVPEETQSNINAAFEVISDNKLRNEMIEEDVRNCIMRGRTPVILTRFRQHAEYLYEQLKSAADHVYLLYGGNSEKQNLMNVQGMKEVAETESVLLIATGQKIGEGFDFPRLDTLFLASPVSFSGRLEQFAGRLNRDYPGKKDVLIYDYIDSHIRYFSAMYAKRLRTYRRIGFQVVTTSNLQKQTVNAIFDAENYVDVFERDLIEAEKDIFISSPGLITAKVKRIIFLMKERQEKGVAVHVITTDPECLTYESPDYHQMLIAMLRENGFMITMKEDVNEKYAVIDGDLVWHGSVNLLGKEDSWDNLIRIHSKSVAQELLGLSLQNRKETGGSLSN